ncbi:MAG: ZIP family metal transporter [Limnohabitans sp.]|nr:ZIP family metal transporter [Limnohabitans sp.]
MTVLAIVMGTLAAGLGSVLLAAVLTYGLLSRYTQHMLSLAAGALLATSFMHLLPEAFESGTPPQHLFMTLLLCVVFFFLLDKAELWHHGHEHHHGPAAQAPAHDGHAGQLPAHAHDHPHGSGHGSHSHHDHGHYHVSAGGWTVLLGDSVHAFGDGVLVAAAFMADLRLGLAATLAVLVHEVPHHMGDLVVLRQGSAEPRSAVIKLLLTGGVTVLGGLLGYWLVEGHEAWLPYLLTAASGSYIYVALADLIPQLQRRLNAQATLSQVAWLFAGMLMVMLATRALH